MNLFLKFFLNIFSFLLVCESIFDKRNFLTFKINYLLIQSCDRKNDKK